tara:strand:+ start:4731 stop:5414 length:684 start_codon:yes stop_codon:yes gene_type:complete
MTLKLVSFDICPYVQRSVITLLYKNIPFEIDYIDLSDKPDWFLKISPMGKVPVVVVDGDDHKVLFESAVINEYVDEISGGDLMPSDPFEKARARAWIEYAGGLMMHYYQSVTTDDAQTHKQKQDDLINGLLKMKDVAKSPYFLGEKFSLVDSSIAPLFVRMKMFGMDQAFKARAQNEAPNLVAWFDSLTDKDKDFIQNSAPSDLFEKTLKRIQEKDSYIAKTIKTAA